MKPRNIYLFYVEINLLNGAQFTSEKIIFSRALPPNRKCKL